MSEEKVYYTKEEWYNLFKELESRKITFETVEYHSKLICIKSKPTDIIVEPIADAPCEFLQFKVCLEGTTGFVTDDILKIESDIVDLFGSHQEMYYIYFKTGEKIILIYFEKGELVLD